MSVSWPFILNDPQLAADPVPTSENSFCGIKVYTSPDLVSWTYEGYAYDKEKYPNPAFRPKVEYRNACVSSGFQNQSWMLIWSLLRTSTYYLFFNNIAVTAETNLAIFTSNSSTGPFEFASYGHTIAKTIGDFAVQQDENSTVSFAHHCKVQLKTYPSRDRSG